MVQERIVVLSTVIQICRYMQSEKVMDIYKTHSPCQFVKECGVIRLFGSTTQGAERVQHTRTTNV